jgi:hypothetical protein
MRWYYKILAIVGHPLAPVLNEFINTLKKRSTIPPWYREFVLKARQHVTSGDAPQLELAPMPTGGYS